MEGATTFLSNSVHFPITPKGFHPQSYTHSPALSARKRKPAVTYQSPGSGVVDLGLLVRNTALEFEAAATAAALRSVVVSTPTPATPPLAVAVESSTSDPSSKTIDSNTESKHTTRISVLNRPVMIPPRPPRPLYHPLSRPSISKPTLKTSTSSTSITSQISPPSMEPGRRSSSRTRRPAPKVRDTEAMMSITKAVQDKLSPTKRRRGAAAGKRKRGGGQQEADGDGTYPAAKRSRKPKEKIELEIDGETMPPPATNGTSPPSGYSTRAKRPRKVAHVRAGSSTSDGTGSVARTTPVNGHVEEFWVPTKAT